MQAVTKGRQQHRDVITTNGTLGWVLPEPETRMSGCVSDVSDASHGGATGLRQGLPRGRLTELSTEGEERRASIRLSGENKTPGLLGFLCWTPLVCEALGGGARCLADARDRMWAAGAGASCCITQLPTDSPGDLLRMAPCSCRGPGDSRYLLPRANEEHKLFSSGVASPEFSNSFTH